MAEEPDAALRLPAPAPVPAAEGDAPPEASPDSAPPEPPSPAAASPGSEEPAGDARKKIYLCQSVLCPFPRPRGWNPV
ncbi:ubiquitin-like protein ATG12 isoform X2 [Suncus etruscus]|uniref:ubiquitin-like protein ATG12 isoform X2 n=1 Tax=Suncus etruscus TaxID=109475 RepID=UPI00210FC58D|nr:ubiquitin-like protein ATG12 isoform X2 [Suncus etruscus]